MEFSAFKQKDLMPAYLRLYKKHLKIWMRNFSSKSVRFATSVEAQLQ